MLILALIIIFIATAVSSYFIAKLMFSLTIGMFLKTILFIIVLVLSLTIIFIFTGLFLGLFLLI